MKAEAENPAARSKDEGYLLLGALVAIALVLIALSVAATSVAFSLRREREEESVRRANQYVRAIREFYIKFHRYPGSIEQLENTNNVRFLRKRYVDPLTGKSDWRLIGVGQNKTTVTGFFGQPLEGLPTGGLGAAAGMQSAGMPGSSPTGTSAGTSATAGTSGLTSGLGATTGSTATSGSATTSGTATGTTDSSGTSGSSGLDGLGSSMGSGAAVAIMGVGSNATGNAIITVNGQTTYQTWEFLYDPRVELLKIKQQMNSGMTSTSANALGSTGTGTTSTDGSATTGSSSTAPAGSGTGGAGSNNSTQP